MDRKLRSDAVVVVVDDDVVSFFSVSSSLDVVARTHRPRPCRREGKARNGFPLRRAPPPLPHPSRAPVAHRVKDAHTDDVDIVRSRVCASSSDVVERDAE
jgi:hypothetical protein